MKLLTAYRAAIANMRKRGRYHPDEPLVQDYHTRLFIALARKWGWNRVRWHSHQIDAVLRAVEGRKPSKNYRTIHRDWAERYRRKAKSGWEAA